MMWIFGGYFNVTLVVLHCTLHCILHTALHHTAPLHTADCTTQAGSSGWYEYGAMNWADQVRALRLGMSPLHCTALHCPQDVIIVAPNHRLGPLGFTSLGTAEAPGNQVAPVRCSTLCRDSGTWWPPSSGSRTTSPSSAGTRAQSPSSGSRAGPGPAPTYT
jgi:hypothetical protein